ncbi:hypothetical protein LJ655_09130 [Paraburkholderia sp. MMS20-SJTN17]|uniref:Uncharacterized protein n=1 Tax=Paraburkholderia translucens TaxID=2886945 RepID=A0ABS8KC57_9BURK|nr:hypothetical protein [Paraburkholderia sp. MMS20-SJTN17]MCC8402053.1 hypothetical protein [Paraburkholderia sp. MMS20-SJTN17]
MATLTKLNKIPFDAIGKSAQQTLVEANTLLKRLDTEVTSCRANSSMPTLARITFCS